MTRLQKLQLAQSENRTAIGDKLDTEADDRGDDYQTELDTLTKRARELEVELRAAIVADGGDTEVDVETRETVDDRELADLEARASLGGIFDAAQSGGVTDGAEAELQQHLGLAGNQVPLALLRRDDVDGQELELRTSGVTAGPTDVGTSQAPIIPAVFPQSAAAFLRIPTPTVPVGERAYTVVSTSASPGTPAKGAAQAHSAGALTASVLAPARIQASLFYAREDAARLADLDSALRENLSDALADELDQAILTGTNGLLTGTKLPNNNASAADSYASYLKRFAYDRVDGRYAMTAADLRLLIGTATLSDMAATYRASESGMQALSELEAATGGVRVSANVTAAASNKQNAVIRRGNRMDAAAPVWEGLTLIVDPYSQSKAGEIIVTAIMLYGFAILRQAGFAKVQAQHS